MRINAPDTEWARDDVAAMADVGCDALLVPKVSRPEDLAIVEGWLSGAPAGIKLWAMIETPLAILNVAPITKQLSRLSG